MAPDDDRHYAPGVADQEQRTREMRTIDMPAAEAEYEFMWGRWRIPDWLGYWIEDLQAVPWRAALTLMWIGFFVGVVVIAAAVIVGFYFALS